MMLNIYAKIAFVHVFFCFLTSSSVKCLVKKFRKRKNLTVATLYLPSLSLSKNKQLSLNKHFVKNLSKAKKEMNSFFLKKLEKIETIDKEQNLSLNLKKY